MKNDLSADQLRQEIKVALPLSVLLRINDQPRTGVYTIDASGADRAGLERLADAVGIAGKIGDAMSGGVFAGVTLHADRLAALILLDGDTGDIKWAAAKDWAKGLGGELPSRHDMLVLYRNLPKQFKPDYYWTGEQNASNSDFAWFQVFDFGYQYYNDQSYKLRARAVRRVPL